MPANPTLKLVERFGDRRKVANRFRVTTEAVRLWLKNGIPPERALEVQDATSGEVTADEILQYARQKKKAA